MERIMEPKEWKCGRTMKQNENGQGIQPLPANKQFSTQSCARCAGLLVREWYYGMNNTGEHSIETFRCVQCGYRVDPVILQNQIEPSVESHQVRQVQRKYSARTGIVRELA